MRRRLMLVLTALLLFAPSAAQAQDAWQIYGPDDPNYVDTDIAPSVPAMRKMRRLMMELNSYNLVDASETCVFDQQFGGGRASGHHGAGGTWDDPADDDARCNRLVEIVAAIAGLRGVIIGDLVVAYCIAAEVVQEILPSIVNWLAEWHQQAMEHYQTEYQRYRSRRAWEQMSVDDRLFFIYFEQVALQLIVMEPPE